MYDEVVRSFFEYAETQGNPYKIFPLGTDIEEFGAPYVEVSEGGRLAIVAKDRGVECFRRETESPSVMARWVYEMFNI